MKLSRAFLCGAVRFPVAMGMAPAVPGAAKRGHVAVAARPLGGKDEAGNPAYRATAAWASLWRTRDGVEVRDDGFMRIPIYQVDAFASGLFTGNPAAVCPLEAWLPDATLQAIAAENNLSETAFFVKTGDRYRLRWMTPCVEVDLCGHATLAAAYVIFRHLEPDRDRVEFDTLSGQLAVGREADLLSLDFPSRPPEPLNQHELLERALGGEILETWASRDYLVVYGSEAEVRGLRPDMALLSQLDRFAVIVTATGQDCDFVSRFFAPAQGVPEDPVTGSAHCTLTPFWAKRYGKKSLFARQVSARGGELWCEDHEDRVRIRGRAAEYLRGEIEVP